jgi:Amt family ammonium transporter
VLVYAPLAHWVWGGGFIAKLGAIDFAGGTVVHISAGMGALASVFVLGKRKNTAHLPHNITSVALGAALLWFGWYGFNAGSALAATGQAAAAFANTDIAASMAMVTWLLLSWFVDGKPSVVGALTGAVAGLVAITPAAGYVTPTSSLLIGIAASLGCFYAVKFRMKMGWDDALDVWGCHGVGGIIGSVLTGVFAAKSIGGFSGLLEGNTQQFIANIEATAISATFAFLATYVLLIIIKAIMSVKVDVQHEEDLDKVLHGEEAYAFLSS